MTNHVQEAYPVQNKHTLSPEHIDFLATTFARNRALYAGWLMEEGASSEDEAGEDSTNEEGASSEDEAGEDSTNEEDAPADEESTDKAAEDEEGSLSREDALAALSKTRRSEAKYRTRLRELEKQLEDVGSMEQVQALIDKVKTDSASEARALLVENVALKHGLPDALADALKGNTREELDAHAKVLAQFAPSSSGPDPDASGGLDPDGDSGDRFTVKQAREAARRARGRR